jgi:hypothetical protein
MRVWEIAADCLSEYEATGTLTELSPTKSNGVWHANMCKNKRMCFVQNSSIPLSHYRSQLEASEAQVLSLQRLSESHSARLHWTGLDST